MARTSKATKSSDAPVVENVVAAPVAEKAPKVKKTKEPVVVASAAMVASDAAVAPVSDVVAPEGESLEASIVEQSTEFNAKIQQVCS